MTAWVDAPSLTAPIAKTLINGLADAIKRVDEIEPITLQVGIHSADLPFEKARETWIEVVKQAARLSLMRKLVEHVRDNVPAARPAMIVVLSTSRAGGIGLWYRCEEPKLARLLGPGARRALIDRYDLSDIIDELTSPAGRPILRITGGPGRGKTHSRYLLQHMIDDMIDNGLASWEWVVIDIPELWPADEYRSIDARDFIGELSAKLGLFRSYEDVQEHTENKRIARELVNSLVGRFKQLDAATNRMLFIDGLDRANVGSDVAVAVAHIARNIETGDLKRVRLVLTGYEGDFSPAVLDLLNENHINPIDVTYVERFFEDVGSHIDKPCSVEQAQMLAERALANASIEDLAGLGREVSNVAHDYFGGAS